MFWSGHRPDAGTAVGFADGVVEPGTTTPDAFVDAGTCPGAPPDPPEPAEPLPGTALSDAYGGSESDGDDEGATDALVFRGESDPPDAHTISPMITATTTTTTAIASARRRQ
ncbi:hypothetical protein GCM10009773_10550 [Williamsia serinedens]